jgi:hypothetical protein
MTSSNVIVEPTPVVAVRAEHTPEAVDGLAKQSDLTSSNSSNNAPFEFLPVGDAFGVCDLDGECR